MTEDRLALFDLIDQSTDDDLVRDMLAFAAGRIMEMEVEARTGAAPGARSADRRTYRNGYRERAWETRAGRIELDIPKLRKGTYFPFGPLIDPPDRSMPSAPAPHSSSPAGRPRRR
jgi:putative transposase